jgi:hypothetical protein
MTDGTIYGTGRNSDGQLGTVNTAVCTTLTLMTPISGKRPQYIACGADHTIVLMTDGTIYGTGYNGYGQLGTGAYINSPELVPMTANNTDFVYISGINSQLVIADICFPANTPIYTDQGIISIDHINPDINTINNMPIVDITQTTTTDKYLVCFKKNAFDINIPYMDTLMSMKHKVFYEGKLIEAYRFLDQTDKVIRVPYNGEILYNILMETYYTINVNNMICETLHPDNIIAKLYTKRCKYDTITRDMIVMILKDTLKNKNYEMYNMIAEQC